MARANLGNHKIGQGNFKVVGEFQKPMAVATMFNRIENV